LPSDTGYGESSASRRRRAEIFDGLQHFEGFMYLCKLRLTWGNWKRAKANAREEAPFAAACERRQGAGAAYEAGYSIGYPDAPRAQYCIGRVREAVDAGLPLELEALCEAWLGQQVDSGI
jgi:hypothetical protein